MAEKDITEQEKSFLGRGVHFPIQTQELYGTVLQSSYEENIRQSVWLILMTSKGERVMRPEFGCNIQAYAFEDMNYTTISRVEQEVRDALVRWEPRITDIQIQAHQENPGTLQIHIHYRVRSTNNPYNLVFPFQFTEGYGMGGEP